MIQGNTITNLVGGDWVHAIGLEANTLGVLVTSNTINPLVSPSSDAVAVWFEVNNSYEAAGASTARRAAVNSCLPFSAVRLRA